MFGLLFIIIVGIAIIFYEPKLNKKSTVSSKKLAEKIDKLWDIAQDSIKNNKYLRAEKALLTILRVDERNANAYNRLGIIYAKQKAYKDAIECFEIAQSLEPSASSLHNAGLIYLESTVPSRHIAYAKVLQKLGRDEKAIKSIEKAVELDRSVQSLRILLDAYEKVGDKEKASEVKAEIDKMLTPKNIKSSIVASQHSSSQAQFKLPSRNIAQPMYKRHK